MERQQGAIFVERGVEIMSGQLERIEDRLAELSAMAQYIRAKIEWAQAGKQGIAPTLKPIRIVITAALPESA